MAGGRAAVEAGSARSQAGPDWPEAGGRPVLFLLDAANRLEARLLDEWIRGQCPPDARHDSLSIPPSRRLGRRQRVDPGLESALASGDDPLLAPLRVIWSAHEVDGRRAARPSDLLKLGDPRDPGWLRAQWVLKTAPERCQVIAGEPAPASELRERWRAACVTDTAQTLGLAEFVSRQAALALERAERRVRGARYKVPRFVHDDILARPAFRGGLHRMAREQDRSEASVTREASRALREIAATHSPFVIDLVVQFWRAMYTRGYGELRYSQSSFDGLRALAQRHPIVFLPTHKSNLDHAVLQYALHENGLPPNHTAGGINMNFFPLGPLVRRSGVFFIRRSFKDKPVYKFVLQNYIDFLIEKRFPLEWYVEGGRSRSGKLLPPRFGLLAYVVDAYRRGKAEDVLLLPISIAYDQISDVGDYAAEQRGAAKEKESFSWFLRFLRRLGNQYGNIQIAFGEPVSLKKAIGQPDPTRAPDPDEENLSLQKLAFEVCVRINRATPITPVSLVTLCLLGRGDRAMSVAEIVQSLSNLVDYVARRGLPTSEDFDLDQPGAVERTLEALAENGVVTCYDEGAEAVYQIGAEQHLAAAYYRNTVIHFFVNDAIAELALVHASDAHVDDPRDEFWNETLRLRDLLKFEFFFAEKDAFRAEVRRVLLVHDPDFDEHLGGDSADVLALLGRIRPFNAHRILRPFLEAYRVVGDALEAHPADAPFDEAAFMAECLALGNQYRLQRRIRSAESVSKVLFGTALKLARNRRLVEGDDPDLPARRAAFAEELRDAMRRVEAIDALVRSRLAGLID